MRSNSLEYQIISRIRHVIGYREQTIGLHEPVFLGNEWAYVKECLDTGWVSSAGKYVDLFEKRLAEYTGAKHAVAVVNGTAALHTMLLLSDVKAGDEVIIPSLTFVATANAVAYCGAIPHFADVEMTTLGLDPDKLTQHLKDIAVVRSDGCFNRRTGRKIKALLPMHTFGHPVQLEPLIEIAERYKLILLEDAAEGLGSYYKGKHVGTWGKAGSLSFNGNKIITTGGGGAILTNDTSFAVAAKHLTTTAKLPHRWEFVHDKIGYNYRMPNINAALGCAQLERMPVILESKRYLAARYIQAFAGLNGVRIFQEPANARSNYWLNVLLLERDYWSRKESLLQTAHDHGLLLRPVWKPVHTLPMYQECPATDMEVTMMLERSLINLPSGAGLANKWEQKV